MVFGEPDLVCDFWTELGRNLTARIAGSVDPTAVSIEQIMAFREEEDYKIMERLRRRVAEIVDDPDTADAYRRAHEAYLADRARYGEVDEIAGISAGGMPTRVKCLHALAGHALAAGPGVNPIGDAALALADWSPDRCACADPGAALRDPGQPG